MGAGSWVARWSKGRRGGCLGGPCMPPLALDRSGPGSAASCSSPARLHEEASRAHVPPPSPAGKHTGRRPGQGQGLTPLSWVLPVLGGAWGGPISSDWPLGA